MVERIANHVVMLTVVGSCQDKHAQWSASHREICSDTPSFCVQVPNLCTVCFLPLSFTQTFPLPLGSVMPQDTPSSSHQCFPRVLISEFRNSILGSLGRWAVVVFATPSPPELLRWWVLLPLLQNILCWTLLRRCPGRLPRAVLLYALPPQCEVQKCIFIFLIVQQKEINTFLTVL